MRTVQCQPIVRHRSHSQWGEAGGDAAQQCGSSLVFRVRHFHRRMCFPEAERRCWIAAGVAVTIVAHRTQPIENN